MKYLYVPDILSQTLKRCEAGEANFLDTRACPRSLRLLRGRQNRQNHHKAQDLVRYKQGILGREVEGKR